MFSFLPLLDGASDSLLEPLRRLGPVIVPASAAAQESDSDGDHWVLIESGQKAISVDKIISYLDHGAQKVIVPASVAAELQGYVPRDRVVLSLESTSAEECSIPSSIADAISGAVFATNTLDIASLSALKSNHKALALYLLYSGQPVSQERLAALAKASITPIIPISLINPSSTTATQFGLSDLFLAPLNSDRPDGLFPTIVSAANHGGASLGMVYSSRESIAESIITGKGVYQSRKHGLWRKGETSGATQTVLSIRTDCDHDALEFHVIQEGAGFCHLNTPTCFGDGQLHGLAALEATLLSRKSTAVEGSYTQRLFNDTSLLAAKIREEAQELIDADKPEDVAFEAADLIYFALTHCVSKGVSLSDVERALDRKAKKVSRRPGNAKPQYTIPISAPKPNGTNADAPTYRLPGEPSSSSEIPITMRSADLAGISPDARVELLKRPVLKSDEMIAKVKPIVQQVRERGDAALVEFAAKFDRAQLTSTVIRPPFARESMHLSDDVRNSIDIAYENIRKFHAAQMQREKAPLVVETMPGVVCTRFAKPVARVGLYVPGGTAVLPSTALMLGIPAQVAGCKEIVIATPPRSDGSISPEVMYVAHLVGASAILRAGGAQAVAALAYGTEQCPKVDKIFGPGNQWVTAAKMFVQNDTDALVSIDMPAGPSEVLVISDSTGNSAFIAADLLSQAEHGVDSQVVLVAVGLTEDHLASIAAEIDKQARALPRVDIVRQSIPKSIIVKAKTLEDAIAFSNDYAPEHLILHLKDARGALTKIENAGSVFVGGFTPESCGDYASGTNHTLPTNGYARQFSGVNTLSFQKHITSQEITPAGLQVLGPVVVTLAECEGLTAHANAVRVRLQKQG